MKKINLLIIVLAVGIIACNNEKSKVVKLVGESPIPDVKIVLIDSLTYSIATHASENVDSTELAGFKFFLQGDLIDYIFKQIYEGNLKAYDFLSDEELSIDKVKEIENTDGYERTKVGKVQFNEQWFVDKTGMLLKRVNSMTLGVERFSKQGTFIGYNALFTIKFNTTAQ